MEYEYYVNWSNYKEDKQTDAHKNINSFATGNILG